MRTVTIKKQVYKFNELDEDIQYKIKQSMNEGSEEHFWNDDDSWKEINRKAQSKFLEFGFRGVDIKEVCLVSGRGINWDYEDNYYNGDKTTLHILSSIAEKQVFNLIQDLYDSYMEDCEKVLEEEVNSSEYYGDGVLHFNN